MKRRIVLAWVGALCSLLAAGAAQAKNDPLGSGTTKLILDQRFASFLVKDGIKLSATRGAKRKGSAFVLPVSGGSFDPTVGKGEIDTEGALVFEAGGRKVPLRDITLKTTRSPLIAKVGGGQLKLATSSRLSARRAGFGSSFGAKQLKLTAKLVTRLNKKLRPKLPFVEGQPLGSLTSNAQPKLATVAESGQATLVFDPSFVAKLNDRFVSLNPIFPAEHQGSSFSFPIVLGGSIAPDGSEGVLRTGGAVELLQLGAGQVFWREIWLDLGVRVDSAEVDVEPTPAFPGKLGRIGVFDLAPSSVSSDPAGRTVSVSGASLALQPQTAKTLNEAFAGGKEVFGVGETAGSLSFTAQAQ